jgi:hypothetical protein
MGPAAASQAPPVDQAERKRQLDLVMRQVLAEPDAAFRPISVLYQDFLVRCRIMAVPGKPADLAQFRRLLATARAGIDTASAEDDPDWSEIMDRAHGLPEDVQGVFLLLARAALDRTPCPSDNTIARAYGSRSLGRARRLLTYLEEQGSIVCRQDLTGQRIVALPALGHETAPGDPNAPEAVYA